MRSSAEADAFFGPDQRAREISGDRRVESHRIGEHQRLDAIRRERIRSAGSDASAHYSATARQQIDGAAVITAGVGSARAHRPRNEPAIFDFTHEERRATREDDRIPKRRR